MASVSDLLQSVRAESVHGSRLEITQGDGALLVRRRAALHFVLDGEGVLDIPETADEARFSPGSVLLVVHGAVHRLRPAERNPASSARRAHWMPSAGYEDALPVLRFGTGEPAVRTLSLVFDLGHARANVLVRALPDICHVEASDEVGKSLVDLLEQAVRYPGAALFATRFADLALIEVIRRHAARSGTLDRLGPCLTSAAPFEQAIAAINAQPGSQWSLVSLAALAGMSRSAFASGFTRRVGQPPMAYVTQARMLRAAEILRSTDLGTRAVAAQIGYRSGTSMARSFRRFFGVGPAQYRRGPSIQSVEEREHPGRTRPARTRSA
ncbi:AraC family transcriptional regulator [Streptomyces sp. MNU77]|uniref:helix-turn-helix transcriptional regulator n=1 Tax=Streptomyces sp. MNU77 TaxID=1573406 RepID=UPI00069625B3|nr:AraC family transcriptional regulator [Streptomyces sp. MNU77]OLO25759.1 AraC family transcriptional regulator [Streptomyces sp. MNU77]